MAIYEEHKLSNVDPVKRTGLCSQCGYVKIRNAGSSFRCSLSFGQPRTFKLKLKNVEPKGKITRYVKTYGGHPSKNRTSSIDACYRSSYITGLVRRILCKPL